MGQVKNLLGDEIIQATTEAIRNIEMDSLEKEREEKNFELEKRVRQMLVFKDKILDDVEEGWVSALDVALVINKITKVLESLSSSITEQAFDEAQKFGTSFSYKGFKVSSSQGRRSFDYSGCEGIVDLENQVKGGKEFLKKCKIAADAGGYSEVEVLKDGTTREVFPDENGELIALPTIKYGKSFITIK